jgi:DNA-binding MarR family transcriptional regulator
MDSKEDLKKQVFMAARDQGINNVLFRNAIARKLGLSVADNECMSFLTIKGGVATPTEIARYTGLTTGSTTAMLDRLEKAGFIARKPNPNDRRGVLVTVSHNWQDKAMPLVQDIQAAHRELIEAYSEAELKTIVSFLTGFTENVAAQTKKIENS